MVAETAAAEFDPVEHDVVVGPAHGLRIAVEQWNVLFERRHEGLMYVGELALGVSFEKRKVDDQQDIPFATVGSAEALAEIDAQTRQDGVGPPRLVGLEEDKAAGSETGRLGDRLSLAIGEKLCNGRLPLAVLADANPGEPLGPEFFAHELFQAIDFAARQLLGIRDVETFDNAPRVDVGTKRLELTRLKYLGQITKFEGDPGVGLVGTVAVHRFFIGDAPERPIELDPSSRGTTPLGDLLEHLQDIFDADERHLEVDLGEFELAIGPQFFVAETACELVVALATADHQQLLHDLRRLGQCIEASGLQSRGHQKVARALWR